MLPDGQSRRLDYVVRVNGDHARPQLEEDKHTDPLWIDETLAGLLLEHRAAGDSGIYRVVLVAFGWIGRADANRQRPGSEAAV